ncbi:MAG: SusD/RagB family nutrient-binding outer membrane lipoprotein [Cytophagales bacterium]|nr:SusD/RagB family nutrient-binding outer membrane lipoprotein [Cytophagales bacterium]
MKKIIFIFTAMFMFVFSSCTDDFLDTNTHPYQISDESLKADFNHVGAFYPTMLNNIFGDQIEHNLAHESFVRHLATPTPFVGGVNNTTYYIRWNTYWNRIYNNIMAPARQVKQIAEADGAVVFVEWANLIQIIGTSRLSAYHGPIIYSEFGSPEQDIFYDSEETLYNTWFQQLDQVLSVFKANTDYVGLKNFDASYGGDVNQWIKVANSWRLMLAMRLSKVKPALAKEQAEKAISDDGGLIEANADNWFLSLYGGPFRPARICFNWGDTRMSATMESVLVGYEDPRIENFFDPATDDTLYPDHPDWPYKGIRNGAFLVAKDDRLTYSTIDESFISVTERRMLTASDILFTLAEAALRGWNTPMTAQEYYEAGVRASFEEWGAGGVDAYLADDAKLPIDYDDPKETGDVNDFVSRMDVTVKWDEGASNEVKLDKIMTQKWISSVHNTIEIWVDHRRTGYPKLPFNYQNDSNSDWGVIPDDDFLRRMPFVDGERNNNPAGVADATEKLGGPDEIGTRLWWDTGGPNFP